MKSMKNQHGFTIIELVVTMIVVAILVSVAAPSFTNLIKNNRLTTQANDFLSSITFARSEAIKRGDNVVITSKSGTGDWSGGWTITVGATTLRDNQALKANSTLTSLNFSSFTYASDGLIDNPDTLNLCDDRSGETGRQIDISPAGRASISDVVCP